VQQSQREKKIFINPLKEHKQKDNLQVIS